MGKFELFINVVQTGCDDVVVNFHFLSLCDNVSVVELMFSESLMLSNFYLILDYGPICVTGLEIICSCMGSLHLIN